MNIVLQKSNPSEYYVACVKQADEGFVVWGKYVTKDGDIRDTYNSPSFDTNEQAVVRCRNLAKMKIRKKGFSELALDQIPIKVAKHMEMPPDVDVSAEEMLSQLKEARNERYVVFKDTKGIEEYFDAGVEYLAHTTGEEGVLLVFDRFGESRQCFSDRMESITATEEAKRAQGIKKL